MSLGKHKKKLLQSMRNISPVHVRFGDDDAGDTAIVGSGKDLSTFSSNQTETITEVLVMVYFLFFYFLFAK